MGFRHAILQSFAVLASTFSGLISYGVFQICYPAVNEWQWLFIVEGFMTLITNLVGFSGYPRAIEMPGFRMRQKDQQAMHAYFVISQSNLRRHWT